MIAVLASSVIGVVVSMNSSAAFLTRLVLPAMVRALNEQRVLALAFCFGAFALLLVIVLPQMRKKRAEAIYESAD